MQSGQRSALASGTSTPPSSVSGQPALFYVAPTCHVCCLLRLRAGVRVWPIISGLRRSVFLILIVEYFGFAARGRQQPSGSRRGDPSGNRGGGGFLPFSPNPSPFPLLIHHSLNSLSLALPLCSFTSLSTFLHLPFLLIFSGHALRTLGHLQNRVFPVRRRRQELLGPDRLARPSRRRGNHFADTFSPSLLKHRLNGEGGAAERQSRRRLGTAATARARRRQRRPSTTASSCSALITST